MAAASDNEFDGWLSTKLTTLNSEVDLEVFVSYIRGILEEEAPDDEKNESVEGFLAEITENDLCSHVKEILDKWNVMDGAAGLAAAQAKAGHSSLDEKLADIMEAQQNTVVKKNSLSKEDKQRKDAILKQYGHVSDGEDGDEDDVHVGKTTTAAKPKEDSLLFKNVNSSVVSDREKAQRESEKQESAKKKEKDKVDREKQKQKAQERKEAEKKRTQKGEKRR